MLEINGSQHHGVIEIGWTEGALIHRGKALPDGTRITAEGEISISKVGSFPGSLILFHNKSHMLIVNEVPLERYVQSVVQSEVPSHLDR